MTPPTLDLDRVEQVYAEDARILHPWDELPGGPPEGRDAIKAFLSAMRERIAALSHVERQRFVAKNGAVIEGTVRGIYGPDVRGRSGTKSRRVLRSAMARHGMMSVADSTFVRWRPAAATA